MRALTTALILVAAVVNLAPAVGVLSSDRLQALYGVALDDPNLVILMRHRAVLFGIVGGLLVAAAFTPSLRPIGYTAGFLSMLSFVVLVWHVGSYGPQLARIAVVDGIASAVLLGALVLDHVFGMADAG